MQKKPKTKIPSKMNENLQTFAENQQNKSLQN
jgi:hypothetical protein